MTDVHEYRAQFVEAEMISYGEKVDVRPDTEGYITVAGDMIADILHVVAARTGLPPADVLRAARFGISHFAATKDVTLEEHIEGDIGPDSQIEIEVKVGGEVWTSKTWDTHLEDPSIEAPIPAAPPGPML